MENSIKDPDLPPVMEKNYWENGVGEKKTIQGNYSRLADSTSVLPSSCWL